MNQTALKVICMLFVALVFLVSKMIFGAFEKPKVKEDYMKPWPGTKEKGQASLIAMMVVLGLLLAIAGMAIPAIQAVNQGKNEAIAIGNMQTVLAAVNSYYAANTAYPPTNSTFFPVLHGCPTCDLPTEFNLSTAITLNGYSYTVSTGSVPSGTGYIVTAEPVNKGMGRRSFCIASQVGQPSTMVHGAFGLTSPASVLTCLDNWVVVNNSGQGPTGPPGPVSSYNVNTTAGAVSSLSGTYLTSMPAGLYVVSASVTYRSLTSTPVSVSCAMNVGSTGGPTAYSGTVGTSSDIYNANFSLVGKGTVTAGQGVALSCGTTANSPQGWLISITAVQVNT